MLSLIHVDVEGILLMLLEMVSLSSNACVTWENQLYMCKYSPTYSRHRMALIPEGVVVSQADELGRMLNSVHQASYFRYAGQRRCLTRRDASVNHENLARLVHDHEGFSW